MLPDESWSQTGWSSGLSDCGWPVDAYCEQYDAGSAFAPCALPKATLAAAPAAAAVVIGKLVTAQRNDGSLRAYTIEDLQPVCNLQVPHFTLF